MKKSRAVIALILTAVITGLMAYTALVGLVLPVPCLNVCV